LKKRPQYLPFMNKTSRTYFHNEQINRTPVSGIQHSN
jgi:hypothetical protein